MLSAKRWCLAMFMSVTEMTKLDLVGHSHCSTLTLPGGIPMLEQWCPLRGELSSQSSLEAGS